MSLNTTQTIAGLGRLRAPSIGEVIPPAQPSEPPLGLTGFTVPRISLEGRLVFKCMQRLIVDDSSDGAMPSEFRRATYRYYGQFRSMRELLSDSLQSVWRCGAYHQWVEPES